MPNLPNMQSILRGELVKKFESVVKQEMADHQKVISSYHQEMQTLRDSIKYALEQCETLYRHSERELKEKTEALQNIINELSIKIKTNSIAISDHKQTLISLFQSINEFVDLSVKKSDFNDFKKEIDQYLKDKKSEQDRQYENQHHFVKQSLSFLEDELKKIREEIKKSIKEVNNNTDHKFSLTVMDKDVILKEIRLYKKDIFIIEKKIENLYTLIERINTRGETCPKLA